MSIWPSEPDISACSGMSLGARDFPELVLHAFGLKDERGLGLLIPSLALYPCTPPVLSQQPASPVHW